MKFDYDKMYESEDQSHIDWVKKMAVWKACQLCSLIDNETTNSIIEIGSGRGDVLNACLPFKVKIAADISKEALEQQRREYGNQNLVVLDADKKLPFADEEADFVLLCDILEHVENPTELLRQAGRVGKNVMLKIPVENALLVKLMHRIRGIKYGTTHPSGHLHCWKLKSVYKMIEEAGLEITKSKFIGTSNETTEKGNFLKKIFLFVIGAIDRLLPNHLFSRFLIGGSFFAIAKEKSKLD